MSAVLSTEMDAAQTEVLAAIHDMYDAFLANDRERFDSHLSPGTLTWESHLPRLYTRAELDEYRDRRTPAERPVLRVLRAEPLAVDVWDDTAVVRYLLIAVPADDGEASTTRVTEVLRRGDDGWRIVHHHAEARPVPDAAP